MLQKVIKLNNQNAVAIKSVMIMALASLFLFANKVSADWGMPAIPPANVPLDFDQAVLNLTNWILGFVAMIAVLAVVWGGVTYIGSVGDENKAASGKRVITYALIGLVIAGIAYAIVNIIVTVVLV